MRIFLLIWAFAVSVAAVAVPTSPEKSSNNVLEQDDHAVPSKTISSDLLADNDAATPTYVIRIRPTRTIIPDWISPPFNVGLDVPVMDEPTQDEMQGYFQDAPHNNIPERVVAGPPARPGSETTNDGGTRQVMFHQRDIYQQFQWAANTYRSLTLDPQNVNTQNPGLRANGETWPRPLRVGGNLIVEASGGGELDLHNDLILEFPVGEAGTYFGVDFSNVPPPGPAARRHVPSNHMIVFGYHRSDIALTRPLYVGMITREGYTETTRTRWHWCPVVNYDATPGPTRNVFGYPWQGINPTFRLGTIAYFLRNWLITTPFVKQPRNPRMVRDVLGGVDPSWVVDEEMDSTTTLVLS
ncbi:hypothetical protein F4803DRAFT_221219 [Xylaria telfairii]|nr:hypothetical protein F4803DRAFT_221219 [Xylaria telfairii]